MSSALWGTILLAACGTDPKPAPTTDTTPTAVTDDADGDGYPSPDDCDDADSASFPGGLEILGDAADGDCDGDPDRTVATPLADLAASGIWGVDLGADADDVWLLVTADAYASPQGDATKAVYVARYRSNLDDFKQEFWSGYLRGEPPAWTAGADFYVDDDVLVWAAPYVDGGERNVSVEVLPNGTVDDQGMRILAYVDSAFADVDLLALDDGTFLIAGCDPAEGELVVMHGTAAQFTAVDAAYGYAFAVPASTCAVGALAGAMVVADPDGSTFDLYTWSDEAGLAYSVGIPGHTGFDLDTLQVDGQVLQAVAEGLSGLRLTTPAGESWWAGASVYEVDLIAAEGADLVSAVLDRDGAPWLVWGAAGGELRGVWLGATLPVGHDIAATWTPEGDLVVAVANDEAVTWARFGLPPG